MNPTKFTWTDPVTNVDGSPITPGEITGYDVGVRLASSAAGSYPIVTNVPGETAGSELLSALSTVLAPGTYSASIRASGPVPSAWANEVTFIIAPPQPSPPTNFSVA